MSGVGSDRSTNWATTTAQSFNWFTCEKCNTSLIKPESRPWQNSWGFFSIWVSADTKLFECDRFSIFPFYPKRKKAFWKSWDQTLQTLDHQTSPWSHFWVSSIGQQCFDALPQIHKGIKVCCVLLEWDMSTAQVIFQTERYMPCPGLPGSNA